MAARENQGYLIAVIILVLLSLILALAAFLGLSKASENADLRAKAEQEKAFLEKLSEANELRGQILKAMIGDLGPTLNEYDVMVQTLEGKSDSQALDAQQKQIIRDIVADVKSIKTDFDSDVEGTASVADDGVAKQTTYREFINNLLNLTVKKVKEYGIQTRQATLANEEAERRVAQMQNTVDTVQGEMEKLRGELESEKQRSKVNEDRLKGELADANQNLDRVTRQFEEFQQTSQAQASALRKAISDLQTENQIVKTKLNEYERESFVNADGRITKVSSPLGTVFIDLGLKDGLTNNMTFSVYDQSVTNFDRGNSKAAIEIIRVDQGKAEARITQQNPADPILPGDHILTPTWDPGYPTKFALVGRFDLDGDDVDDTEKLARMIERNGGLVIAKHDSAGKIEGEIDPTTRYLVEGNAPIIEGSAALSSAMTNLKDQAERNTVEKIDLQKLLNRMGVRPTAKTKSLGLKNRGLPDRPSLKASDR